ncbi:MAG TPA: DUF2891 family protein [Mycobacteriales bacterium]|nr:DUF2891 family protein [Mycobacteriales bacterium]
MLESLAAEYAAVAVANVRREYPNDLRLILTGPGPVPPPRDLHPAFYGSFDWHSCVEMHWLLVRLHRLVGVDDDALAVLDEHLSPEALTAERDFLAARPGFSRPYGLGWALMLAEEAALAEEAGPAAGRPWAAALRPFAQQVSDNLRAWLPKATYPIRQGAHANTAFGLRLALPWARRRAAEGDGALLAEILGAAERWYLADRDYPAGWEPDGADFLSAALCEAELMVSLAGPAWLDGFLPALPEALLTPVTVTDDSDGQLAHLHGLNLSRAWAWTRLAAALPADDPRVPVMRTAAAAHAAAGLPHAGGGTDYMVEHWLAVYAVLYLTAG